MSLPGLKTASLSDVGRVRVRNEDSFGEFLRPDGSRLLVVADGMGGHRAGETASRVTVETVGEVFGSSAASPEETLRVALETANARVHGMALESPEMRGMGTTAVLLLLSPDGTGSAAHVGDSRLYRYRDDVLRALTQDHSVVAELERRGLITADEAAVHPRRNEIMRSVGIEATVDVEVQPVEVLPGDRYLLCSDGLSGMLDDTEIAVILDGHTPEAAAQELVARANEHGGHDNVTVQIASVARESAETSAAHGAAGAANEAVGAPQGMQIDFRRRRRTLMVIAVVTAALAASLLVWSVVRTGETATSTTMTETEALPD